MSSAIRVYQFLRGDIFKIMVKKADKAPMPASARAIAASIRGLLAERGVTQEALANALARSQSYVSDRVGGLAGWDTLELESLAVHLGFRDAFDLLAEVARRVGRSNSSATEASGIGSTSHEPSELSAPGATPMTSAGPEPRHAPLYANPSGIPRVRRGTDSDAHTESDHGL